MFPKTAVPRQKVTSLNLNCYMAKIKHNKSGRGCAGIYFRMTHINMVPMLAELSSLKNSLSFSAGHFAAFEQRSRAADLAEAVTCVYPAGRK